MHYVLAGAKGGQRKALALPELELQAARSHMWVLEPSLGPLQEQPVHLTTAPFLQPLEL